MTAEQLEEIRERARDMARRQEAFGWFATTCQRDRLALLAHVDEQQTGASAGDVATAFMVLGQVSAELREGSITDVAAHRLADRILGAVTAISQARPIRRVTDA